MYKGKNIKIILIVLSMALLLTACSSGNSVDTGTSDTDKPQETITWRLAHEFPEDHPYHLGAAKFSETLNELSDGKYEVIIYPNGQLGTEMETADMVASGQLEFSQTWQGNLEVYDPDVGVLSLPFLYDDWDHVWKVVDGEIGDKLFKNVESKGLKVIGNYYNGLTNIVSTKPIESPEDMKGVKLRVQESSVFTSIGNNMGALVTPMAFSEIYSGLQLNAIDAEIQSPLNVRKSKHYEVAKHTCRNNIAYLVVHLLTNTDLFESLSETDQNYVLEAAREAELHNREVSAKQAAEDEKYIQEQGMVYYEADRDEWREALQPVYDEFSKWKDMIDEIQAIE